MLNDDILPRFDPERFTAFAAHCFANGQNAGADAQQLGLEFPMVLDFDSELFRYFRLPEHVFPLNVVVDADGSIAAVTIELDEAVETIESLLEE